MKQQYKISIVTAVYNVEPFLAEMLESVVNQTIGLEHIQLILVDDGSTDGSGKICDEYATKYPENITVIHKENGGVSSARNEGLKHVKGELVNFLDSDDKLSENALKEVYAFYQKHKDETDLIAIPLRFFDGQTGDHILNYKFDEGSRIVDLDAEWMNPQLHIGSSFIKREMLDGMQFDVRLKYAEDAQLIQKILGRRHTIGFLASAEYGYRRRSEGEQSAIQLSTSRKAWYNDYLRYFSLGTITYFMENDGYVPAFVQNTIMYDLQWRLKVKKLPTHILSEQERKEYHALMHEILGYIQDSVIEAQHNLLREHKIHALRLKREGKLVFAEMANDIGIQLDDRIIYKMSSFPVKLEYIDIRQQSCTIEARINMFYNTAPDYAILAVCNGQSYGASYYKKRATEYSLDEKIYQQDVFKITVPLCGQSNRIDLYMKIGEKAIQLTDIREGNFWPVCKEYENSYYCRNEWMLQMEGHTLIIRKFSAKDVRVKERNFCKELWVSNGEGERKAAVSRAVIAFLKKWVRKPIWLISDRGIKAGDNGEAFFRYLRQNHREINSYFVICRDCEDFHRMAKVGNVLVKDSFKHKLLLLLSDYIISSHAEVEIYNPFNGYNNPYRDILADIRFIFLQHGVTKDDVSNWLNKYNKNLYGFITAANPEYASIVDPNSKYFYTDREVWLTGFPRYDRLYRDEKRKITIMPTWRQYLMSHLNRATGQWIIMNGFEKSEFFRFYNDLLNNSRLLSAAKKYGYSICFFPHPNVQQAMPLFQRHRDVEFLGLDTEYREVYAYSDLVVSDYSSAIFDFAYLRKPIIYTHFDARRFFAGDHVYEKGYFNYERDGFGEVEYDLEGTVDRIIEYMANGCQMKDKYKERVDQFFAYNDQNNCQRLYDHIMELEREDGRQGTLNLK